MPLLNSQLEVRGSVRYYIQFLAKVKQKDKLSVGTVCGVMNSANSDIFINGNKI
jgi:hypothetical protein